jgi:pimeloyl-ACP methyl ester carboxylesterase
MGPGPRGILNALSPKYCNWADMPEWERRPPVLWTHGAGDLVVSDASPLDFGTLGSLGAIPGWPGADAFPPQPMVAQIRAVLERYRDAGGRVEIEIFEESGHAPFLDAAERWSAVFFGFLESVA